MPELPEVETVRRRLEGLLRGNEISEVELRCTRLRSPVPPELTSLLDRSRVSSVGRMGKYLLIHLSRGTWIVHLGMSGRFLFGAPTSSKDAKHDHLILRTSCGQIVRYNDFRKFGRFAVAPLGHSNTLLARLGIDAMSRQLNGELLFQLLRHRAAPIKVALLDQGLIAGLGNIYSCESLYWAGIDPSRPACSMSRAMASALVFAIQKVLLGAIEAGGSTLRDYAGTSGELGAFHHQFAVFERLGFPCPRCASACVSKVLLSKRTTYFCPKVQH